MQVIIQETPPIIEKRGFGFADMLAIGLITALLAGLAGLIGGVKIGETEKEREMKERYGIVESTPLVSGQGPIARPVPTR